MRPRVQSSIQILITISQLFGTIPLYVGIVTNDSTTVPSRRYIAFGNILHIIWTVFILVAVVALMYLQLMWILSDAIVVHNGLMFMCKLFWSTINCTIALLGRFYQRSQLLRFEKTIQDVDRKLASIFQMSDAQFSSIDRRLNRFVWLQLLVLLALCLVTLVLVSIPAQFLSNLTTITQFSFLLPNIIQLLSVMQFYTFTFVLCERLNCIEADLKRASRQMNRLARWQAVGLSYVQLVVNIQVRLKLAQSLYRQLNDLEKSIHKSYGVLLIATMIEAFLMVTMELYQFYVYVMDGFCDFILLQTIKWFLLHIGKSLSALYLSSRIRDAVRMLCSDNELKNAYTFVIYFRNLILQWLCIESGFEMIRYQ